MLKTKRRRSDILWPDHIQWHPPTDQTLYRTRPSTEFWVVSIEHLRRVWHADRGRLLLKTPGPVPFGLAYVLLVETNPFPNLSLFYRTMLFEYPSVLSRFCLEAWGPVNRFNHTRWVAFVTLTDRLKSVRNRCDSEVFGCGFMLSRDFLEFSVAVGDFVIGLSQIWTFFS